MAGKFPAKPQSLRAGVLPLGGAVAQRLRGFKSAEPEKTVKRSSRRIGVNLQFFPVEPTPLGLKGASSPFFVAPARRNRCDLAVLNAQHLLRKPVCDLKAPLGLSCLAGTAALFFSFGVKREHPSASRTFPRKNKTSQARRLGWFESYRYSLIRRPRSGARHRRCRRRCQGWRP